MDEERANAERLLKIYRGNLQRLLEQKAKFGGVEVPIWLENQIDETRAQIAFYEPLAPPQKALTTANAVSGSIDLTILYIQGTQIAAEQARQADQNKEIIEQQARDALWRLQAKEVIDEVVLRVATAETVSQERYDDELAIRSERQQEHDERMTAMELVQSETRDLVGALARRIGGMWWLIFDTAAIVGLVVALVMWWFS